MIATILPLLGISSFVLAVAAFAAYGAFYLARRERQHAATRARLLAEIQGLEADCRQSEQALLALNKKATAVSAADQAKAAVLAAMNRELRTRLKAVVAFSDLMRQQLLGPLGNQTYADYAGTIYTNGDRLLGMIGDTSELTRADAGGLVLDDNTVDTRILVRRIVQLAEEQAARSGVLLAESFEADLPLLRMDERRVLRVLLNALDHAITSAHAGAIVTIRVFRDGSGLTVGLFFPTVPVVAEDVAATFGQSGTGSTTAGDDSVGIRLSKRLMVLHGGRLTIGSGAIAAEFPPDRMIETALARMNDAASA